MWSIKNRSCVLLLLLALCFLPALCSSSVHAEAAELDEYGPNTTCERWDLWLLPDSKDWGSTGDYIRGKAIYYQNEWNQGDD